MPKLDPIKEDIFRAFDGGDTWQDQLQRDRLRRPPVEGMKEGQAVAVDARFHLGLSTRDFGELLGLNSTTIQRWESGASEVSGWYFALLTAITKAPRPNAHRLVEDLRRLGGLPVVLELARRGGGGL